MSRKKKHINLITWLTVQSIYIILASFLSFLFVIMIARTSIIGNNEISVGYAFGMVIPLCLMLGALNYYLAKYSQRYISTLADAIRNVADGNYKITLNEEDSGPFHEVYRNFNKMGAELQNVQILRNDFVNSYSHEFKTPISSINGFASLLLEKEVSDQDTEMFLRIIKDESARLAELADNTILLSRLETQQIISDKVAYSLTEQIRHCVATLAPEWYAKEQTVAGDLEEIIYYGNPQLMLQLWMNLLNNAIKFTPEKGEVTIILKKRNDNILVSITDTGIGMKKESLLHIFEKYYQQDSSHTKQGLGLGLSICKRIVDLCEGSIRVDSVVNKGTTFIVTLPLIDNHNLISSP